LTFLIAFDLELLVPTFFADFLSTIRSDFFFVVADFFFFDESLGETAAVRAYLISLTTSSDLLKSITSILGAVLA
jgi:hypothetical protein